jgi:hypothetical protein
VAGLCLAVDPKEGRRNEVHKARLSAGSLWTKLAAAKNPNAHHKESFLWGRLAGAIRSDEPTPISAHRAW